MRINDLSSFWGISLSACYFIYLGEDSSECPIIEMLKTQRIFTRSAIISDNLILDDETQIDPEEEWDIAEFSKRKRFILIFADLKYRKYFFELKKICRKLEKRKSELIIILANDCELIKCDFLSPYYEFASTPNVIRTLVNTKGIPIQKELGQSLFNLTSEHEIPTFGNLKDELDWQSFLLENENGKDE